MTARTTYIHARDRAAEGDVDHVAVDVLSHREGEASLEPISPVVDYFQRRHDAFPQRCFNLDLWQKHLLLDDDDDDDLASNANGQSPW